MTVSVDLLVIVPLLLVALIGVALALFLQRASGALRATRQVERFQQESASLGARLDAVLDVIIQRVDAVRRHETDGATIVDDLASAMAALDQGVTDAMDLRAPAPLVRSREGILAEVAHAQRALAMVQHGCEIASGPRARSRSTEAEISIKRGYLNLLHAREALSGHVADLAEARDPAQAAWRTFRV